MRPQFHWRQEKGRSSRHDHIPYLLCVNALNKMHRGDHFLCEHSLNASSWDEQRFHKLIAQPRVFRIEGPMCRWHLLSGESGFVREPTS